MKGISPILVIVFIIIGVVLVLMVSNNQPIVSTTVIGNYTSVINNSINTTYITTNATIYINTTTVINNTFPDSSVTIPADNVSAGVFGSTTGYGTYEFGTASAGTIAKFTSSYFEVYESGNGYSLISAKRNTDELSLSGNPIEFYDPTTSVHPMTIDTNSPLNDGEIIIRAGLNSTQVTNLFAETNLINVDNSYCEYHKGTQVNYSRCFNATGQLIETIGVFDV